MIQFTDNHGANVRLSFTSSPFQQEANHVLVICQYKGQWLLTNHKKRGLEFPGGKKEHGETLEAAAKREVLEETGAKVEQLQQIGVYEVTPAVGDENQSSFVKAIFYAKIATIMEQKHYFETDGPILVSKDILLRERYSERYSFIMKDEVVGKSLSRIEEITGK